MVLHGRHYRETLSAPVIHTKKEALWVPPGQAKVLRVIPTAETQTTTQPILSSERHHPAASTRDPCEWKGPAALPLTLYEPPFLVEKPVGRNLPPLRGRSWM